MFLTCPTLLSSLLVLSLLLHSLTWLPTTRAANELSYQIHSYNDLRQWPTLLLKGGHWLKLDMNYAPASFCTANTTATARVQHPSDGCLLLNHDDVALNRTAPYNTSDDVLALVGDWARGGRGWLYGAVNVSIALCYKFDYGSVCGNGTEGRQWRALVQSFYDRAQSLIASHNLSLVFVLDGAGSIDPKSPCLASLYGGWPSTYIPYDNSPAAFNSSATPALARSNVLNVYQPTFANVSRQRYGKFQTSPYPWLVWEPSDQATIRGTAQTYLAAGVRHQPGLRFAINIDPVQWEVYASNERGQGGGWNEKRAELAGQTAGGVQAVVEYDGSYYLIILSSDGQSDQLTTYAFDAMLGDLQLNYTGPLAAAVPSSIASFHALRSHTLPSFAAIASNQSLSLYLTPTLESWHQLMPLRSFTLQGKGSADAKPDSFAYSTLVWGSGTADVLVAGQVSISADGSRLYVNVFSVLLTNVSDAVALIASAVVQPSQLPSFATAPRSSIVNITAAAIALTTDDVKLTCPRNVRYDMAGVLSFTTADYDAYVSVVCLSLDGRLSVSSAALIDTGSSPSLSIATSAPSGQQSPTAYVLLTLSDSYCYNNEPANKDAFTGLCDHTPTPLSSVLTYTYARLADLAQFIRQAADSPSYQQSVICSPLLLHGAYDMGSQTSVLLWTGRDGSGEERLGVVEVHVGMRSGEGESVYGVPSGSVCGLAEPFDGLVIDAWQLPQRTTWRD